MKTHADQSGSHTSQVGSATGGQETADRPSLSAFSNQRPDAAIQKRLMETADNSPKLTQLRRIAALTASSKAARQTDTAVIQRKINATTLPGLLTEQQRLQEDALKSPREYAEKLVTVGFEHEFGAFTDETLHGVSHLRIGESTARLPYKNLPFYLETDADNEIELVDPPFLIETVEPGKPVPHPADIDIANQIIEGFLYQQILNFPTLNQLVQAFRASAAIDFRVPPVKVQAENLSGNTKKDYTESSKKISSVDLLRQRLKPSQKYGGGKIATQVNFATNAQTYSDIQERNAKPLESPFAPLVFAESFVSHIKGAVTAQPSAQKIFFGEFHRQLAALAVLPLMNHIRAAQAGEYRGGPKIRDGEAADRALFDLAGGLTSKVKDVNRIWIKDSLMSLGQGILTIEDWKDVERHTAYAYGILEKTIIPMDDPDSPAKVAVRNAILLALTEMQKQIQPFKSGSSTVYTPENKPGFMQHDEKLLGVRQDTYINGAGTQMPGIWDQKLHVIETRSDSFSAIARLASLDRDGQMVADKRAGAPSASYNLFRHGYFAKGQGFFNPVTGQSGWTTFMQESGALKMSFDPAMNMYWDNDHRQYFDQATSAYFQPNPQPAQSYYTFNGTPCPFNAERNMYDFGGGRWFSRDRNAWFDSSSGKFSYAQVGTFKNPRAGIEIDPKHIPQDSVLLLKDIYHDFDSLTSNVHVKPILLTIANVNIPYDTPQEAMVKTAIKLRFGDKVTLRQIYDNIAHIIHTPVESGARMLREIADIPLNFDVPPAEMVMTAYAQRAHTMNK